MIPTARSRSPRARARRANSRRCALSSARSGLLSGSAGIAWVIPSVAPRASAMLASNLVRELVLAGPAKLALRGRDVADHHLPERAPHDVQPLVLRPGHVETVGLVDERVEGGVGRAPVAVVLREIA